MQVAFAPETADTRTLHALAPETLGPMLERLDADQRAWVADNGFAGKRGQALLLPARPGAPQCALAGLGDAADCTRHRFALAAAARNLPAGSYRLAGGLPPDRLEMEALGWLLDQYRFDRYRAQPAARAMLTAPEGANIQSIEVMAQGEFLARDLINTPAADMGPEALEAAVRVIAGQHGAVVETIAGDALITANFPMIHAVGRAAASAPRLIDMRWGARGPKLTLVGKGVCFDTGGLNLKPAGSMGLMKKDMGGAAVSLALASMIMALDLPVQLRLLIPAVENAVAGNAYRPQDILTSRKGLSVEINNTDAEGRLVLADALTLADEDQPELIVSMATLTGAARVALGPDLAPFYTDHAQDAAALSAAAQSHADPVWQLPFHAPYEAMIEPGIADLDNAPRGGFAGSITAALFLRRFVTRTPRYMHFDIYGWQPTAAPGLPKGGRGHGARALLGALPQLLAL